MRISDWSSDVCSSDLSSRKESRMNASTGMSSPSSSTTPGGFAGDVFGQQQHEIDRVLSRLIQDNYDVADARRREPSRAEERRGGKERVSTCRSRWSTYK